MSISNKVLSLSKKNKKNSPYQKKFRAGKNIFVLIKKEIHPIKNSFVPVKKVCLYESKISLSEILISLKYKIQLESIFKDKYGDTIHVF